MGRSCMLAEDMAINQTCYAFIPNENSVDPYYLFYSIKNLYAFFQNVAHGAIFNTVIGSGLKETEIFFPPLPEQKAIAAVLSSLDDKIDLLQRQNATLEAMAQTLFRQWFVEEADDNWEEVPLQNITDIAIGRTPPRKEFHWFSTNPGDNKWMSIKDLGSSGVFIADTSEYLTQDAIERFNIPIIPDKTVVLSFKMTVGRVAITDGEMTSNEAIAHFRLQDDTPFCKEYLYFFLKLSIEWCCIELISSLVNLSEDIYAIDVCGLRFLT